MEKSIIKKQKKVFVSGCYDIIHAGHIQFFQDARSLGDFLIVCFCSKKNLMLYKHRVASLPDDNKKIVLESIRFVDKVVKGDENGIFDFVANLKKEKPDILTVTTDDKHKTEKRKLCQELGIKFVVLPKRNNATRVSTSKIIKKIRK